MRRFCITAALLAVLAGPGAALAQSPELELDRVVAVVDRDVILSTELERRMRQATTTRDAADPRRAMLWAMIDERLLVGLATSQGIEASEAEIDAAIEQIRAQNQLSREELLGELAKQGYSLPEYRDSVRRQILAMRVLSITVRPQIEVTDAEIEAAHRERSGGEGEALPVPPEAEQELRQTIYGRKLDRARDRLVVGLRERAHIDIRLPEGER